MWKMDKDFKNKWLKALRSGDYEQTECYLATETYDYADNPFGKTVEMPDVPVKEGYCCLGVACAVAGVSFSDMVEIGTPRELMLELKIHHGKDNVAVKNLDTKANVLIADDDDDPNTDSSLTDVLVSMNDDKKYSFNKIADYIQSHVEGI
jgi:hypothetical protein